MIIGVPKEIKAGENRVALTPEGAEALVRDGHTVRVQKNAGQASGFPDAEYRKVGAKIMGSATAAWGTHLVVKVKEPLPEEFHFFQPGQILFTFLHLAPNPRLTKALLKAKTTAIGYETVEESGHQLPILHPMSEIAGRVAVLMGCYFQGNPQGGRGVLFGKMSGVPPAHVLILGGGTVGETAAHAAVALDCRVTILERRADRMAALRDIFHDSAVIHSADHETVEHLVHTTDILIGATHMPGAKTPQLVTRQMVRNMKPRSVIIDVAIDQGGSCETSRPTSHFKPVYIEEGVLHYAVPNMPGAYARTSTLALAHVTLPYLRELANKGVPDAFQARPSLAKGVQCYNGSLTCAPVAQAQKREAISLTMALHS